MVDKNGVPVKNAPALGCLIVILVFFVPVCLSAAFSLTDSPVKNIVAQSSALKIPPTPNAEQKKILTPQEEKRKKLELIQLRKLYGEKLREHCLDNGYDITVNVTGNSNQYITLRYPLFNAVWAHRLSKGEYNWLQTAEPLGFKRFTITDGYDYTVYWSLNKK